MYLEDTIVAQATAVGEGAIGIVRLSGPLSSTIIHKIFRSKKNCDLKPRQFYFGDLMGLERVDQGMVVLFNAPGSYTGEDMAEIHCHGSALVLQEVLKLCMEEGGRLAEPGEFTKRAYLNGKMDLSQAEAVADLIAAKSEWQARCALQQMNGALSKMIEGINSRLKGLLAKIEVGFDFAEEDISLFNPPEGIQILEEVEKKVDELLDSFHTGQLYKEGLRVAILGKPNVGKSTLLNLILKEDRAIVHEVPGTTRDIVSGERKISGILVHFYDTAGIRLATNPVEQEGIRRSKEIIKKADLIILVLDSSREFDKDDQHLLEITQGRPRLLLYNKIDLPPLWNIDEKIGKNYVYIETCTEKSTDLEKILEQIKMICLQDSLKKDHNYVLNNVRHVRVLEKCRIKLNFIKNGIFDKTLTEECLSEEIRQFCTLLDQIIGKIDNEQILDEIFSRFCIGK